MLEKRVANDVIWVVKDESGYKKLLWTLKLLTEEYECCYWH